MKKPEIVVLLPKGGGYPPELHKIFSFLRTVVIRSNIFCEYARFSMKIYQQKTLNVTQMLTNIIFLTEKIFKMMQLTENCTSGIYILFISLFSTLNRKSKRLYK